MKFSSVDKKFSVNISEECVDSILAYIRVAGKYETGGILMGQYSAKLDVAVIKTITGPPSDSRSGRTWFNRGVKGLKKMIDRFWEQKNYYLGEWHFHPNAKPIPSQQDKKQMRSIAVSKEYNCPEPILLIVGGNYRNYEISFCVTDKLGITVQLIRDPI